MQIRLSSHEHIHKGSLISLKDRKVRISTALPIRLVFTGQQETTVLGKESHDNSRVSLLPTCSFTPHSAQSPVYRLWKVQIWVYASLAEGSQREKSATNSNKKSYLNSKIPKKILLQGSSMCRSQKFLFSRHCETEWSALSKHKSDLPFSMGRALRLRSE